MNVKIPESLKDIEKMIDGEQEGSLEEKLIQCAGEVLSTGIDYLFKLAKKKQKLTPDEEYEQSTKTKELKNLIDVYQRLKKAGLISPSNIPKSSEQLDKAVMEGIKKKHSTIGEIVRNTNEDVKNED